MRRLNTYWNGVSGRPFKNTYELLNLRALKLSHVNKIPKALFINFTTEDSSDFVEVSDMTVNPHSYLTSVVICGDTNQMSTKYPTDRQFSLPCIMHTWLVITVSLHVTTVYSVNLLQLLLMWCPIWTFASRRVPLKIRLISKRFLALVTSDPSRSVSGLVAGEVVGGHECCTYVTLLLEYSALGWVCGLHVVHKVLLVSVNISTFLTSVRFHLEWQQELISNGRILSIRTSCGHVTRYTCLRGLDIELSVFEIRWSVYLSRSQDLIKQFIEQFIST